MTDLAEERQRNHKQNDSEANKGNAGPADRFS